MAQGTLYLVAGGSGYWGKGETIGAAIRAAKWFRPGDRVTVAKVDPDATVDQLGRLYGDHYQELGTAKISANGRGIAGGARQLK